MLRIAASFYVFTLMNMGEFCFDVESHHQGACKKSVKVLVNIPAALSNIDLFNLHNKLFINVPFVPVKRVGKLI